MDEEDKTYKLGRKKKGMGRKARNESLSLDGEHSYRSRSGRMTDATIRGKKNVKHQNASEPQKTLVRRQADPETVQYFSEIANLFESKGVDVEERSVICGNALEEARGKELELATDYVISHTLQTLLEGCDVDHLCSFLRGCAEVFPSVAVDRSGSHVAETAIKSLAVHLQDGDAHSIIEETLTMICKVVVVNPIELMCDRYGSHVLRSLLCLCKGIALGSSDFHATKPLKILAERLSLKEERLNGKDSLPSQMGFPDLLKFLVSGMLNGNRDDIKTLQVDQYSSLVLQTALKLLEGQDQELLQIIPMLLGCNYEILGQENFIETNLVRDIVGLMKETAFSHLMEVILEVAPEKLYNEIFTKVFRSSLFKLSSHHCGNFVVQALVSHARNQDQMELIWEELGPKFRDLLELGRSGVIASIVAASHSLQSHEHKCCQALAGAVCLTNESSRFLVPRILFLDSYFRCEDKSNWNWASGVKMHIIGSLILQAVFKFRSEFIQPYITSITSMETAHVLEAAKDAGGARVIEAFLGSNASSKLKRRLVMKLCGHFGELSVHSSGSFTVEKCFIASNISLREAIASELLAVQTELSKTKQGPHLLRKLDVDGFAANRERWRSKQASKESTYKEFYATFGSHETKSFKDSFVADTSKHKSHTKDLKNMRKQIDAIVDLNLTEKKKKKTGQVRSENAIETATNNVRPFLSFENMDKKRRGTGRPLKSSKKKLKV